MDLRQRGCCLCKHPDAERISRNRSEDRGNINRQRREMDPSVLCLHVYQSCHFLVLCLHGYSCLFLHDKQHQHSPGTRRLHLGTQSAAIIRERTALFILLALLEISGLCLHSLAFRFAMHVLHFLCSVGTRAMAAEVKQLFWRLFHFSEG